MPRRGQCVRAAPGRSGSPDRGSPLLWQRPAPLACRSSVARLSQKRFCLSAWSPHSPPRLQEIRSTIDQIGLTRNVTGLFAGEKDHHRGALIDRALSGNGDGLYAGAFTTGDFLSWRADDFDTARANEVRSDIILAVLTRNRSGQPFGRHFRRGTAGAPEGGDTRVVDDTSPAVLYHAGQHRLTHQEGRVQVNAHGCEPVLHADAQQIPARSPPCVIHHHVNTAKLGQSRVDESLDLLLVGYITPARHDFHPEWCGQVRGLFQQIHALTRTEE